MKTRQTDLRNFAASVAKDAVNRKITTLAQKPMSVLYEYQTEKGLIQIETN